VVVGHRHAPLRHRARRILLSDLLKSLTRLFVLERVQKGHGLVESGLRRFRTRS